MRNLVITGTQGIITVEYINQTVTLENETELYQPYILNDEPLKLELTSFVGSILDSKNPTCRGKMNLELSESVRVLLSQLRRDSPSYYEKENVMSNVIWHIGNNAEIGENLKIWNLTYIGANAKIGAGTEVGSLEHIDYEVQIGKKCKVAGMTHIPPLTIIEDDVFVEPVLDEISNLLCACLDVY